MNTTTSWPCWHCSLTSYRVSHLSAEAMHHFAGYTLPGLIFTFLGLRWSLQLILEWTHKLKTNSSKTISVCSSSLPWEGIVKLILTGVGIIASVIASSQTGAGSVNRVNDGDPEYVSSLRYATIYLFFALSGLTDILVYYCGYSILPEGIQSFILSTAFAAEALLFALRLRFEGYLEQQIHAVLVVAVVACAISTTLEVLYENRLVKFCRSYFCTVQGTWLIHASFVMQGHGTAGEAAQTYPDSLEWVSILFSWHLCGNFVIFVASLLIARFIVLSRNNNSINNNINNTTIDDKNSIDPSSTSTPPSFHSPTTVQTNVSPVNQHHHQHQQQQQQQHHIGLPPAAGHHHHNHHIHHQSSSFIHHLHSDLSRSSSAQQQQQQQQQPRSFSRPAMEDPPVIVEAVPRDNLVISDEYRTLSREDELRASIKLKESSLI